MFYPNGVGSLMVITGPMYSEKSGLLINTVQKLEQYGKKKVKIYKPSNDDRFGENHVVSRIGYKHDATNLDVTITDEIIKDVIISSEKFDVIAIDEVQFFSKKIITLVSELLYLKKHVIVAGLNMDYRGKEFRYIGGILAMADEIVLLKAYCACCGRPAKHSQRLVDGKPSKTGPVIVVGDKDSYEPRCANCFIPPNKVS